MARSTRAARKPDRPYHHGNLRRALLDEALATIRADGIDGLTLREIGGRVGVSRTALYRHFADKRALALSGRHRRLPHAPPAARRGMDRWGSRAHGVRIDGRGLRAIRRRQPRALPGHVRRIRRSGSVRPRTGHRGGGRVSGAGRSRWRRCSASRSCAATTPLLQARYVWAVVHGIAMLAIDGQLREPGAVDELMRYALERLRTGIAPQN